MDSVEIEVAEGFVVVHTYGGPEYRCVLDEYTGDWSVGSSDDSYQGRWFIDKDSAVKFVLGQIGILDDPDYEWAPDRC